jgi:hypothetical protein
MRTLKAGLVYFLLMFAFGWVLGPIRELWAVPSFGRMAAMLLEAVIMLIAMIVAARWVFQRFGVRPRFGSAIVGLVAFGILVPAEIVGALWVRGLSLQEYLGSFATTPGVISLLMFLLLPAMPALVTLFTRGRVLAGRFAEFSQTRSLCCTTEYGCPKIETTGTSFDL